MDLPHPLPGPSPIKIIRPNDRPRERSRSRERNLPRERSRSRSRERDRSREYDGYRERSRSRERNLPRGRSRSRSRERDRSREYDRHRDRSREYDRPRERELSSNITCFHILRGNYCHDKTCPHTHPRGYMPGPRHKCRSIICTRGSECKFGHWEGSVCPYKDGDFIVGNSRINPSSSYVPISITAMPKTLKQQVWDKRFGAGAGTGKCYCCKYTIIRMDDFQAGHVTARSKGGSTTIDNLEPICARCNKDMKQMNLYEFQAKFHPPLPSIPLPSLGFIDPQLLLNAAINPSSVEERLKILREQLIQSRDKS